MRKIIEIESINYDTIDELMKKLKKYKKEYGGESTITIDISLYGDCGEKLSTPEIYYRINIKEKERK